MDLLTTAQLAEWINIAPGTLRYWRHRNRGEGPPSFTLGKSVRYDRADVLAWVRTQREDSAA